MSGHMSQKTHLPSLSAHRSPTVQPPERLTHGGRASHKVIGIDPNMRFLAMEGLRLIEFCTTTSTKTSMKLHFLEESGGK